MKKYKITLNNKVYEVDIEEVKPTSEEDATLTKIGSLDKIDETEQYFESNESGI